ncbi:hypothetical protein B0H13DRAFT_1929692 [Mycena leptocephala]|nr:hypothetical protein B0H13DRAFT_1929692 [Mycena leptocephala]
MMWDSMTIRKAGGNEHGWGRRAMGGDSDPARSPLSLFEARLVGVIYDPQTLKSSSCWGVILADVSMEAGPIFVADIDHGFEVGEYPLVLQPSVGSGLGDSLKQNSHIKMDDREVLPLGLFKQSGAELLASSLNTPFLEAISNTTQSLLKKIQTIKQNKNDCTELLEKLTIAKCSSNGSSELGHSPTKWQQSQDFFRQGEMSTLLKECKAGLQQGFVIFQGLFGSTTAQSSTSISMLPSEPKIFHGRESELLTFFVFLVKDHPGLQFWVEVEWERQVWQEQSFIIQELLADMSSGVFSTQVELAALIGTHLGLKPGKDLTRPVIQHFTNSSHSLLILDNLETLWEPTESRANIEEFLSLLTGVEHLALVITMRGAERPAKVAWTRPFLQPLKPLEQDAARQTFIDVADNTHNPEEMEKVLALTDNMPLAINLLAHLVDSEGCSNVLSRWEEEKTSLISIGYDKRSNLDLSISLSLSSTRLDCFPHSKDLLSLLSMLPDGLSDAELVQAKLPIDNILGCKAVLIQTTLAYSDEHKRLKALVPIREYMQKIKPPGNHLVRPLLKHFKELLELFVEYYGTQSRSATVARISSNYSNIQNILWNGAQQGHPDLCAHGWGTIPFTSQIQNILPSLVTIAWRLIIFSFVRLTWPLFNFCYRDTGRLYLALTGYYWRNLDISTAKKFCGTSISLALSSQNTKIEGQALVILAEINWICGDYFTAQVHANRAQRVARISADLYREARALDIENHKIMTTQAEIHKLKSEYIAAHSIHFRILQETSADQDFYTYGLALLNGAEIDAAIGTPKEDVQRVYEKAREIFSTRNLVTKVVMCDAGLADLSLREENFLLAKTLFESCLNSSFGVNGIRSYCLERLGNTSCWGAPNWMSRWTTVFLVHSVQRREKLGIYKALQFLGDVFLAQDDEHTAINLFTVALKGFTYMDVHRSRAECMLRLGDISKEEGDLQKAVELWTTARPLFEKSSQAKQVEKIDHRLAGVDEDVLGQHRKNLACLAELNAPSETVDEINDLSDIEDMEGRDLEDETTLDPLAL